MRGTSVNKHVYISLPRFKLPTCTKKKHTLHISHFNYFSSYIHTLKHGFKVPIVFFHYSPCRYFRR